jgi:hypothetical protein
MHLKCKFVIIVVWSNYAGIKFRFYQHDMEVQVEILVTLEPCKERSALLKTMEEIF